MSVQLECTISCKQHPRYKAVREPKSVCEQCWAIWIVLQKVTRAMISTDYIIRRRS